MSFTASRIRKKACAHWWKSASPIGRIAKHPRRFFNHSLLRFASFSRALTLSHSRHTLEFHFAGKGSGEGRVNRPRSRHCDRLKSRKPGHPPVPQRAALFARKSVAECPKVSRGAFLLGRKYGGSRKILEKSFTRAPVDR